MLDYRLEKNREDLMKRVDSLLVSIEKDIETLSYIYLKIKLDRDPTEEELKEFIEIEGWRNG